MASREFGEDYLPPGYIPGQYNVTHRIPGEDDLDMDLILQHARQTTIVFRPGDKFGKYVELTLVKGEGTEKIHGREYPIQHLGLRLHMPERDEPLALQLRQKRFRTDTGEFWYPQDWKDFQVLLKAVADLVKGDVVL